MALKSIFAALVLSASPAGCLAASPAKRSQTFLDACEGYDRNAGCTVHFKGTCVTEKDKRFCVHTGESEKAATESADPSPAGSMRATNSLHEKRLEWVWKFRNWTRTVDSCADKEDGDACSFHRDGQCARIGGCPVFGRGEMVCEPWDDVPPERVTKPCLGKAEGSRCTSSMLEGTCHKHEVGLVCKVWRHQIP